MKKEKIAISCSAIAMALVLSTVSFVRPASADWRAPSPKAIDLARNTIIVDGHVDVPYRVAQSGEDVGIATDKGDFDYPRAMKGGLNAPFMSIYVAATYQASGGAKAEADRLIGLVEGLAGQHPDKFEIAKSVADLRRITAAGKIALPMGMENGAPIEGDLANLDHFWQRGIRYITLTHSLVNHLSDSSYDTERRWGGLSAVKRMNDLGIIVDISHVSDEAFYDVIKTSRVPVIASHSSLRHFTPGFERNMSDEMVRALGKNGGIIMINYGSAFLDQGFVDWRNGLRAAFTAHMKENGLEYSDTLEEKFTADYTKDAPIPFADVDTVIDHIDRVRDLVGVDHIGLGSDFDGVGDSLPTGLKDASMMPNLIQGLMDRGYSEGDIIKILSGNALRVWQAVEDGADDKMMVMGRTLTRRGRLLKK